MAEKPIIETAKVKRLLVTIQYVFKANFNDSYWLEQIEIDPDALDREQLTWFDPYNGRSKQGNTLVAVKYCSDDKLVLLKNETGVISEETAEGVSECILCEDYDQSMLLASHIRCSR